MNDENILGMSDEEFMKLPMPTTENSNESDEKEEEEDDEQSNESQQQEESSPESEKSSDEPLDEEESSSESHTSQESGESKKSEDKSESNYQEFYEQITKPFKANGKEVKVNSAEEAISLMQMGANYHKKMASLKPNLKMMQTLEKNGLLSEDKISFLVDLANKDLKAVSKLIKDGNIDLMDLDTEGTDGYVPKTSVVNDSEYDLNETLSEIRDTPTYSKTISTITSSWDNDSKTVIYQNPELIKVINDHMASGIYEIITNEVAKERMFGRLQGMSDLAAYKTVGDAIQQRGGFDHIGNESNTNNGTSKQNTNKKEKDLKDKKRAASSPKGTPKQQSNSEDINPLTMSDEEFMKLINKR